MRSTRLFLVSFLSLGLQTGCGILIGDTESLSRKSDYYEVADLEKTHGEFVRVRSAENADDEETRELEPTEMSDLVYQSSKTQAVISISTACRKRNEYKSDLKEFTDLLLLGISNTQTKEETPLMVAETPALKTTLVGDIEDQRMQIQAIVLKRGTCVFDLMLISAPDSFSASLPIFEQFVASLRLK